MLTDLYQSISAIEIIGKDITFPETHLKAIYLSERGQLFCYVGICECDENRRNLVNSWPYYMVGKHSYHYFKKIIGMYRLAYGCILLCGFLDHETYNKDTYKQLTDYFIQLPYPANCYYGILKENMPGVSNAFEENEELTRDCFGLTYDELEKFTEAYAKAIGAYSPYLHYPKVTRSLKSNNFCDITGAWIPAGFPYIAFSDSGYAFSHVSLYGFYRYIGALLGMSFKNGIYKELETFTSDDIIEKIRSIDDYFPFEQIVTHNVLHPNNYIR